MECHDEEDEVGVKQSVSEVATMEFNCEEIFTMELKVFFLKEENSAHIKRKFVRT